MLAVVIFFKIDATTLSYVPLSALDELGLLRNFIAETGCWAAAIEARAHEDAIRDRARETGILLITRNRFVNAPLIVGLAAKVLSFGINLLASGDPGVFITRDPVHTSDHDADHEHDNDNDDCQ